MSKEEIPHNPLIPATDQLWKAGDDIWRLVHTGHHEWNAYATLGEMKSALKSAATAIDELDKIDKRHQKKHQTSSGAKEALEGCGGTPALF